MNKKAHAKLGASTSEIWLNCSGAPNLWEEAPEKAPNAYADEGTQAHELLEMLANYQFKNKKIEDVYKYPKTMFKAVDVAINDFAGSVDEKTEVVIEEKVSLDFIGPDMFGTVDLGAIREYDHLEVADYKHGRGVKVEVMKESASGIRMLNTQLVYYALGLAYRYDFNFKTVTLKIIQPRYDPKNPISKITIPMAELLKYIDLFKRGVERTMKKDAKRYAGPWCRFCKAKPICKESANGYRTDSRNDF